MNPILKILKDKEKLINIAVMLLIFAFILNFFKPSLIFWKTITSGGDTASHYYPAFYLKNYLLPKGKIIGWSQGWYAGIPMFQFYFLLPYILMSILSIFIGLPISFKIITAIGTFLLPICSYFSFKFMNYKFPIPIISSIFTLPFLFMEANSMWGGNIPSTLAGEFSFSLSLALTVLFMGSLYKGVRNNKYWVINGVLFALILFSHVLTAIVAALTSLFFLIYRNRKRNFKYLFKVYFLSLILVAFWLFPMIFNLEYTTSYADTWSIGLKEAFPWIITAFLPLSILGIFYEIKNKKARVFYLLFFILVVSLLFILGENIGVINVRFLPFVQLMSVLLASTFFIFLRKFKLKEILPLIVVIVTLIWVNHNINYIPTWMGWNYEGFENKPYWEQYSSINNYLKGDANDPRVVYEHSGKHDSAGTPRAFESLPLFSGRSTLEGLYMQSTPTSPFIFYVQSEISKEQSCPFFNDYPCTSVNLEKGTEHLKMFNVKHFIAVSNLIKQKLRKDSEYKLRKSIDPYEIYELTTNKNKYVSIPKYQPILFETDNWKRIFYEWFKREDLIEIPLIPSKYKDEELEDLPKADNLDGLTKIPLKNNCSIKEKIRQEEINFNTTCIGKPHIIKISYYPNWKVEGAEKVYLVSPSFMLVYPNKRNVKLYYGQSSLTIAGNLLTFLGLVFIIYRFFIFIKSQNLRRSLSL